MAGPIPTLLSMESLRNDYAVFERDQVLTEAQLNSVAQYFDEQDRLTRTHLIGVGIYGGLHALIDNDAVLVGRGVGVATDGDILMLQYDTLFDSFKPYDETAPYYAPFYTEDSGKKMMPMYELIRSGESDVKKQPLSELPGKLSEFAVVLYMESYLQDHDLCSAADCDNLGIVAQHNLRVLLVRTSDAPKLLFKNIFGSKSVRATVSRNITIDATLIETSKLALASRASFTIPRDLPSPSDASLNLAPVIAERPRLNSTIQSSASLAGLYRAACMKTMIRISDALQSLSSTLPGLLIEQFGTDPLADWLRILESHAQEFASNPPNTRDSGIQYYYDFLKDVAETWNELVACLFENDSVLCPDFAAFPKHLVLGELQPLQGHVPTYRTGTYPSPLGNRKIHDAACGLVRRLDTMIRAADFPPPNSLGIRITPSRDERAPLGQRAIPFYYQPKADSPILPMWNHTLTERNLQEMTYAYHWNAYRGTLNKLPYLPYNGQIGASDFFRIEGHQGIQVDKVMEVLKKEIEDQNLPISVRAVLAHTSRQWVFIRPPRYTDIYRMHSLFRKEVAWQLSATKEFSAKYKDSVKAAATAQKIPANIAGKPAATYADEQHNAIASRVDSAAPALQQKSYTAYRQAAPVGGATWQAHYTTAIQNTSKFRTDVGDMMRTEFANPFDFVVNNRHGAWLDWMDILIDKREELSDNKLMLHNFFKLHPGMEHFAGVSRGGTFILVYDDQKNVVADFMLPYMIQDIADEETEEPDLPHPGYIFPDIVGQGYKLPDYIDKRFVDELKGFEAYIKPQWMDTINIQKDYQTFFIQSLDTLGGVLGKYNTGPLTYEIPGLAATGDPFLDSMLGQIQYGMKDVEQARKYVARGDISQQERTQAQKVLDQAESNLGRYVNLATDYMVDAGSKGPAGQAAQNAVTVISNGARTVTTQGVRTQVSEGLNAALGKAGTGMQAGMVQNIMNFSGMQFGK